MNEAQVLYMCGCWHSVPIERARSSACPEHGQSPAKVNTHEWRVRCMQCRYGRWCGQSEDEARRLQRRHREQHPTHFANVAYDRITPDGQGTLLADPMRKRGRKPSRKDDGSSTMSVPDAGDTLPPF